MTLFRLEGFAPSVEYRINNLSRLLSGHERQQRLDSAASRYQWQQIRDCKPLSTRQDRCLWRISCAPSEGHRVVEAISRATSIEYFYDWQGGLIWLQVEEDDPRADLIRAAVRSHGGGHATLIRAEESIKRSVSVFEPQAQPLAALSKRYRQNFDPHGILNPGRMGT